MASETKNTLLQRHHANADLNAPGLPHVARGDNDLAADGMRTPLDERIIAAAADALEAGETHYVDVPGIAPLREAIARQLNDDHGSAWQPSHIIITAGVQESRFLTIQKIGELYDSVGLPAVVHPGARKVLGLRERNPRWLPADMERGGLPAPGAIAEAAADGCRLFYLESPARLSGAMYSADEVSAIDRIMRENDAAVIWDQGLAPWVVGDYASLSRHDSAVERVAAIGEALPGQGLASWFIGSIAAPEAWIAPMQSQKQIMAICTSTAAQYAALEASKLYADARSSHIQRLGRIKAGLLSRAADAGLDALAGDAVNIMAIRGPADAMERLRGAGFEAADGRLFGAPGVIRLNVATTTGEALDALTGDPA